MYPSDNFLFSDIKPKNLGHISAASFELLGKRIAGRLLHVIGRYAKPATRMAVAALALVPLSACGTLPDETKSENSVEAIRIAVAPAERPAFGAQFSLSGTLTAERQTRLSARVDGLVSRVHVDVGDHVTTGQVLLELDPAIARQTLVRTRAEAQEATVAVDEAERLATEAQRLIELEAIPATEAEARAAALTLARAAVDSAHASAREQEERVARHVLPAPFAGVIAAKLTEIGEWVERGTPVLMLVATDRVRLDLQVPQERFGQITKDTQVRVFADAFGDTPLPAHVSARVPVTDPDTRTFLLRLLVDDPQGRLLPGSSARAEILLPKATEGAVVISRDALLHQPDGSYHVYVVEDTGGGSIARLRPVQILHDQDGTVTISDDSVKPGELVATRGNESLIDGQPVHVVEH